MILDYIKIYVCRNDWILYMKEYEKLNECLMCGELYYELKDNDNDDGDGVSKNENKVIMLCSFEKQLDSRIKDITST